MAKDHCSDPFTLGTHPREVDSPSGSYCKECAKRYQRERYRMSRQAAGKVVINRVEDPVLRLRMLREHEDQPGTCEACFGYEPKALVLVGKIEEGRTREWALEWGRSLPFALFCQDCVKLVQDLGLEDWDRLQRVSTFLTRMDANRASLLL